MGDYGLRESPHEQYDTVQKLYVELQHEREASSTAANEALSMILRLQGEKATEKMEACQYRRMAEEKIQYIEELLANYEEILFHKDEEIAFLKIQLQVYRDRLLRFGTSNCNPFDFNCLDSLFFGGANATRDRTDFYEITRRDFIMPAVGSAGNCHEMDTTSEIHSAIECSDAGYMDRLRNTIDDEENVGILYNTLSEFSSETSTSDNSLLGLGQHIEGKNEVTSKSGRCEGKFENDLLNHENVHVLPHNGLQMPMQSDSLTLKLGNRPSPCYSTGSNSPFCHSTIEMVEAVLGSECISSSSSEHLNNLNDFDREIYVNKTCPMKFHDVFEVPQCTAVSNGDSKTKVFTSCISERKDVSLCRDEVLKVIEDSCFEDEEGLNKPLIDGQYNKLFSSPRRGNCQNYNWACKLHENTVSCCQIFKELWQSEIRQIKMRLQILEEDRKIVEQEGSNRGEQLLLREISQQLQTTYFNFKKSSDKKHCHQGDTSVISFMEAMLHFSV